MEKKLENFNTKDKKQEQKEKEKDKSLVNTDKLDIKNKKDAREFMAYFDN